MDRSPGGSERGLRDHLGVLRRRLPIVIGITAVAVVVAVLLSLRQPTQYQASADVLYVQDQASFTDPVQDQLVLSKRLDPNRVMQNEVRLADSDLVQARVQQKLGAKVDASAQNVRDSDVIVITATAPTAERAAEIANTWAASYVEVSGEQVQQRSSASIDAIDQQVARIDERLASIQATLANASTVEATKNELSGERDALTGQRANWISQRSLLQGEQALATQNQVRIVNNAEPPSAPSQPATLRNAILALLLGLGLGLIVAYAVDQIDDVIRTPDDLERATQLPLVAVVPGTAARDQVRAILPNDPLLRHDDTQPPFLVDDPAADANARIVLVPPRSHGRKVRQNIALLEGLGHTIVGCAFLQPGPTSTNDERRTPAASERDLAPAGDH